MAIVFFEGFDYLNTATLGSVYELVSGSPGVNSADARTGINGLTLSSGRVLRKNLPGNYGALYAGFAFRWSVISVNAPSMIGFFDNGTEQLSLRIDSGGHFSFVKNGSGTAIAGSTSTYVMPANQFHYIEVYVQVGTTTGACQAWADGVQIINVSGVNTQQTGNAYANQLQIGEFNTGNMAGSMDDIYVLDTTGSAPYNTRLGDVSVITEVPVASGAFTQFSIKPGSTQPTNWQNVNEIPPNGDTTYVFSSTVNNRDSYTYGPLIGVGSILAVMLMGDMETDTGGSRVVQLAMYDTGTTNSAFSPNIPLGVSYTYATWITTTDVAGSAWTLSQLNATQFGAKVIS